MSKRGKRFAQAIEALDRDRLYGAGEAIDLLTSLPSSKFDETVELNIRLGVDPRKADQMVRGAVSLPKGTGKTIRVAAFAKGEQARAAEEAGADVVGAEDLVERIQGGWLEFDAAVATPDMMPLVGRLGRVLGPRGLMP
ncbi:MAG: 50S ribosomal protein L1, partial [Actinomycetota bacterium]